MPRQKRFSKNIDEGRCDQDVGKHRGQGCPLPSDIWKTFFDEARDCMLKKIMITVMFLNLVGMSVSEACTTWGAITPDEILIAKNRDFFPGKQEFKTTNNDKYKIFGLYAIKVHGNYDSLKMGVNEKGLVGFITFATSVPASMRSANGTSKVMEDILGNYDSVEQINQNSKVLFKNNKPDNYLFADRKKAMICEIGLHHHYHCEVYARNTQKVVTFSQTNHYIFPDLKKYNYTSVQDQQTSYARLNKINELMNQDLSNLTLNKFIHFSFNTEAKNDNPLADFDAGYDNTYQDNSIFRTFNSHPDRKHKEHPDSARGLSAMIVKLPKDENKPITLYLRIIDNVKDLNDKRYTQVIQYHEAKATLDQAIYHPGKIEYTSKICKRDLTSEQCS